MAKKEYRETNERVRTKKRMKKKSHRLYAALVIFLGIAIISLSVMILFKVQKIKISGNSYCTNEEITKMVQSDKYSTNSLYIFVKYLTGKGEVLPCLESAKVSLESPWIVKVSVKEKAIIGYLSVDKECAYFDKEGLVVYKNNEAMEGIPLVEGIKVKDTGLYHTIESGESGIFEEILETSQEIKKYDLQIKKIVCKSGNIYLYINKICVSLGNTVSSEQIAQIQPIMEKLGKKKGTLHLENYSENQEMITFNKGKFPK